MADIIHPQAMSWPLMQDLYYALNPSRWIDRFMRLDPWQKKIVDDTAKRIHANTSRQIGKSTIVAGKVWHRAWFRREQLILLIAPTLRQSVELIRKVKWFAQEAGCPQGSYRSSALSIEIPHTKSRIIALPGGNPDNIRGFSAPDMIVIDEASFAKDQLYRSIRPMMMTSNGQIILISTPFHKAGFFWEVSSKSDEDLGETWSRYTIPAWECPRVPTEWLDKERQAMGDWWFNSEYGCKFQDPIDSMFTLEMIEAAAKLSSKPLYDYDPEPENIITARTRRPLYAEE